MTAPEATARLKLRTRPTPDLIRDFILTGVMWTVSNGAEMAMVRGWIMDELENRDPDAYDAWLEQDDPTDESLRSYFRC